MFLWLPPDLYVMQTLDVLALELPTRHVLPDALAFAREAIQAPDTNRRWAACTVLVVCAEGCANGMRAALPEVLKV